MVEHTRRLQSCRCLVVVLKYSQFACLLLLFSTCDYEAVGSVVLWHGEIAESSSSVRLACLLLHSESAVHTISFIWFEKNII